MVAHRVQLSIRSAVEMKIYTVYTVEMITVYVLNIIMFVPTSSIDVQWDNS